MTGLHGLEEALGEYDRRVDEALSPAYQSIELKSRALAASLRRCFREARASERFLWLYQRGLAAEFTDLSMSELADRAEQKFSESDFMVFREFVRLLRACSLHIGGEISGVVKEKYREIFFGERISIAHRFGLVEGGFL